MAPTFSAAGSILTAVRARTSVGAGPISTALQDTAMYAQLHDVNEWFLNYPYTVGMLGFKFNKRETVIQTKANTTLNGALSSGATSMILTSGTDFDSPSSDVAGGYIKTGTNIYDFFTHEAKSTNTLSTVAGINVAHATLEEVHKIYRLPSDYGKPRGLFRQSNVVEYEYLDEDFRQLPPYGYYMVKTLYGTNYSGDFMVFPASVGAVDWKFYYMKKPTTITQSTDTVDAPNGTGRQTILKKMEEYVWNNLGEADLAEKAARDAEILMDKCLSEYATQTVQTNQSLSLLW